MDEVTQRFIKERIRNLENGMQKNQERESSLPKNEVFSRAERHEMATPQRDRIFAPRISFSGERISFEEPELTKVKEESKEQYREAFKKGKAETKYREAYEREKDKDKESQREQARKILKPIQIFGKGLKAGRVKPKNRYRTGFGNVRF